MDTRPKSGSDAVNWILRGRTAPLRPIGTMPDDLSPHDISHAMSIQELLNERLSEIGFGQVVGTKIGCTTKVMQEYLGMEHPCSGAIFDSTLSHQTGEYDFDSFLRVGVECEIAARLGRSIKVSDGPHSLQSVSECVESVHAAIEIVDDRYVDFRNRDPGWLTWIADDFFGAGAVLGESVTDWRSLDLPSVRGTMSINGSSVGDGFGRDIIQGHPLKALVWLANDWASRGRDIPGDWIILLGSVVQTHWVRRGDVVSVNLNGLGQASAVFF